MREADRLQEAGERTDITRKAFGAHLLLDVETRVGVECALRGGSIHDQGDKTEAKGSFQVEVGKLCRHEGVERLVQCATAQEVHVPSAQLAGAGTGQHDAWRRGLLQNRVDNRQQLGYPLNLVDHDGASVGRTRQQVAKPLRTRSQPAVESRFQEVQVQSVGQPGPEPCGLSGSAGAEEEEALFGNDD